jgi:hypothetical protein
MAKSNGFGVLIEAMAIFKKYGDSYAPTHCEHDVLYVCIDPERVSEEDKKRLEGLGFHANTSLDNFESFRFGSA